MHEGSTEEGSPHPGSPHGGPPHGDSPHGDSRDAFDVAFNDVTKRFGEVVAVDSVSLQIPRGGFFSFLGPSGCGKTTSLRMIAGFEQPSEGDVLLQGRSVVGVPPHKRPVNMVFQHYALFHTSMSSTTSPMACGRCARARRKAR